MVDSIPGTLILPEDEPWMSHAFVHRLATQVSLPYRRPPAGVSRVTRRNGDISVTLSTAHKSGILPYGKYPRLFSLWATTMVKIGDPCWNPETNVLDLGSTFREFLRMIQVKVGGRQMRSIKPQLEHLFDSTYSVSTCGETNSDAINILVSDQYHIDWLRNEHQERSLFRNWVRLTPAYADMLKDNPVPVNLSIIAQLNKPMAIDVFSWLTRRYSYLHQRQAITWDQLHQQFAPDSVLRSFKQTFRKSVDEVLEVYPEARITCGRDYVTLYPSPTSVPTTAQTRSLERQQAKQEQRRHKVDQWVTIAGTLAGRGKVYGSLDAYSLAAARAHINGDVAQDECAVCQYDERNQAHHGEQKPV